MGSVCTQHGVLLHISDLADLHERILVLLDHGSDGCVHTATISVGHSHLYSIIGRKSACVSVAML